MTRIPVDAQRLGQTTQLTNAPPVRKTNLVQLTIQRIGEWIQRGELLPGDRLPSTSSLVETFGVSRSVVREALAKLQALGIVEVHQGRGAFVLSVPADVITGVIDQYGAAAGEGLLPFIWEMRLLVETEVAGLAASRRTSQDLDHLESALQQMQIDVGAGGTGAEGDEEFHLAITQATHNPVLVKMILSISGIIREARHTSLARPPRRMTSIAEHRAVLDAIHKHDESGARLAMRNHISINTVFTPLPEGESVPIGPEHR